MQSLRTDCPGNSEKGTACSSSLLRWFGGLSLLEATSSMRPLPTLFSAWTNHPWATAQSYRRSHIAALSGAGAVIIHVTFIIHFYNPRHWQGGKQNKTKPLSTTQHWNTKDPGVSFKVTGVWEIMEEKHYKVKRSMNQKACIETDVTFDMCCRLLHIVT